MSHDDSKHKEVCKSFQIFLQRLIPSQFKDLLNACGDEVFGLIVEVRARGKDGGIGLMSKYLMSF